MCCSERSLNAQLDCLDAAAREGSCGFVVCGAQQQWAAELLGTPGSLTQRFPRLRCACRLHSSRVLPPLTHRRRLHVLSDALAVRQAASAAGATCDSLPAPEALASSVLSRCLSVCETEGEPLADVVLLHLVGAGAAEQLRFVLERADALPEISQRLYMVLLLAVGDSLADVERAAVQDLPCDLVCLRPRQSYCSLARSEDAADSCRLLLCVHRMDGVVRRDGAQRASAAEAAALGARGMVSVRDVIAEVAYKCGSGAKFGS